MAVNPTSARGSPLKAVREALGLTQAQFGALLGGGSDPVAVTTVSRREVSSTARLDWEEIVRLDDALASKGLRFRDFLTGEETETP
jgi:transcriptional regulator with XRE-family HTH domain